jgi:RHS repeat-associated protein
MVEDEVSTLENTNTLRMNARFLLHADGQNMWGTWHADFYRVAATPWVRSAGSLTTQYVYDGLNIAQEQYTGGSVADMLPGLGLDENFARTDTSGSYAMLSDALGSTLGLVNSSGALGTQYQYGPFGQTTTSGTSSTNPFQYTGREMDATGLYFLRARYYNPIAQRFISPDPIGLSGGQANFYAYVFNQPMNWTDPLGLMSISIVSPDGESSTCIAFCGDSGGAPPPPIEALPSNGMNSAGGWSPDDYKFFYDNLEAFTKLGIVVGIIIGERAGLPGMIIGAVAGGIVFDAVLIKLTSMRAATRLGVPAPTPPVPR